MTNCRLCKSNAIDKRTPAFDICGECADRLGVVPLGPARRPPSGCDRCNCMKFVRVIPRELSAIPRAPNSDYFHQQAAPMGLTIEPQRPASGHFVGDAWRHDVSDPAPKGARGIVETYVCTQCGFMEWYCPQPATIPIGPEYMADVVDYNAETPYR